MTKKIDFSQFFIFPFSDSDLIYTEQQTSRKSMAQQLTCACRRQQCNWSRPGNTAVKKIFCAQPFECTNPTDFFPNDYNGKSFQRLLQKTV